MQLDLVALNELRDRFLRVEHDFGEFGDPEGAYQRNERSYKDNLVRSFRELFPDDLFSRDPVDCADDIVRRAQLLLTRPLDPFRQPQNLLSWRYVSFLRKLDPAERATFARGMAELLAGAGSSPERIERFNRAVWPALQRIEGRNPWAITRSFPTLFLMLQNPRDDIYIRSETFDRASRLLLGRSLLDRSIFSSAQYRALLDFAHAVRERLVEWAWSPRDLIDVQGFLYVATIPDDLLERVVAEQES